MQDSMLALHDRCAFAIYSNENGVKIKDQTHATKYEAAECFRIEKTTPEWQPEHSAMAYLVTIEYLSTLHFEGSCHTGNRKFVPIKTLWS
jgi:hypothetical protein